MIYFEYSPTWTSSFLWTVIAAFVLSFLFSYGMGANDCANSWGTSVASGVVKLWQAYILANVFNTLGAVLVGYQVTDTIRNGIFQLDIYNVYSEYNSSANIYQVVDNCTNDTAVVGFSQQQPYPVCAEYTSADYMLGELSAITGGAVWMIFASVTRMPVSATHSIVGASLGFSLVVKGSRGIRWMKIVNIGTVKLYFSNDPVAVISWIASPILAGIISASIYLVIKFGIMRRVDPFESALNAVPLFLWFMLVIIVFSVLFDGSKYLGFDKLSWWSVLLISLAIGAIAAGIAHFLLHKWMRRRAIRLFDEKRMKIKPNTTPQLDETTFSDSRATIGSVMATEAVHSRKAKVLNRLRQLSMPTIEHPLAQNVFNVLQVISATFLQFSHGSNDTANGVAPMVGVWQTYQTGRAESEFSNATDIILFMVFGAFSQVIGLSTLGHRVMRTIGKDITEVSAPSGFAVELGAAFTVLLASRLGIPVSTTHCAVGAVVFVGIVKSGSGGVSWKVFIECILTWVVTLPASGLLAALIAYLLVHFTIGTV